MSDTIMVIGGGAAGMMAAIAAAWGGCSVLLLERNEKLGKKIYITGKGRCNVTNACDTADLFAQIPRNAKFMYSAVYAYDNFRVMDFFEQNHTPLLTERGGRVFPVSGHASDIIRALERQLRSLGVTIKLNARVRSIVQKPDGGFLATDADGNAYTAQKVVLATGGLAYPSTGSTGDGYVFAGNFGHTIEPTSPSLVAIETKEAYIPKLQGLSLKNVRASVYDGKKKLYDEFGELLFTHFGVSGPLILSAGSLVHERLLDHPLQLLIDLKPALTEEQLDRRILHDFAQNQNRQFKNALNRLLPSKLIPVVIELSGIQAEKKIHEITKEERGRLLMTLKRFPGTLTGFRGFNEAVITRGGVRVKEIDSSTMESKLVKGVYFAGELLDVDALTGGYNLQIAWSSGYLAGTSAAQSVRGALEYV